MKSMGKTEIIAQLPHLSPEDRAEVQAKLDELAANAWQDRGQLSDADKQALDAALAEYEKSPDAKPKSPPPESPTPPATIANGNQTPQKIEIAPPAASAKKTTTCSFASSKTTPSSAASPSTSPTGASSSRPA